MCTLYITAEQINDWSETEQRYKAPRGENGTRGAGK